MAGKATDQQATETDEQSTDQEETQSEDQAGEGDSGVEKQDSDEEGTEEGTEEEDLLGQAEYDKLKGDPEALRKALNRAATQKFQTLSAERKALEPYKDFISALDTDPVAAVTAVARQLGIKIDGKNATEEKTSKVVESLSDRITAKVKKALGPDYEDLGAGMGAAIHDALLEAVPELTKSFSEQLNQVTADSAMREASVAIELFAKKYPDWQKHEAAMTALSKKMPPGEGVTEAEYLENLYLLSTRDKATGEGIKKVVTKMQKSAGAAEKPGRVSEKVVANKSGKPMSFKEAYEMAKRNERAE